MLNLPCKNCITLVMCRGIYMECIQKTNGNTFLARTVVKRRCKLLAEYLFKDETLTYEHKTSMFRMYMLGEICDV